jgi:bifunctional enzyme CysN/CysC
VNIVIAGHVDHGKSTLVGRILYETDSLQDGKYEQIKASCEKRGQPFEWAFLMDALQAERDQNITIDTTRIWFKTPKQRYCLIDAPGHREFLKNMITGAAEADAALLLVDAAEGLQEQTRRHAYLLHLLGVKQVVVVINKMDLIGYEQARFDELKQVVGDYLRELKMIPLQVVPVSAREGDGVSAVSERMPWYTGPALLAALDDFSSQAEAENQPLRIMVQDVYRRGNQRIIAGRVESGVVRAGDALLLSPHYEAATLKQLVSWPESEKMQAGAGESVGLLLNESLFVERGHIISHRDHTPLLTNRLRLRLFWVQQAPLREGMSYTLRLGTSESVAEVAQIHHVIDTATLEEKQGSEVQRLQIAEVTLKLRGMVAADDFHDLPRTGRCVLYDGYDVAGGGIIMTQGLPDLRPGSVREVKSGNLSEEDYAVSEEQLVTRNGHRGGVIWLTGLSGSGKSTLAHALHERLFAKGCQVTVLDGDNVRRGLCSDLGFSPEDRSENIRRIGEVAALFAEAGMIVVTAFISPYAEDRKRARTAAGDKFHTVYVKADVTTCESRDVKGLYAKARAGEIQEFTGVSAPYEEPEHPDLVVDTAELSVQEAVELLQDYIKRNLLV